MALLSFQYFQVFLDVRFVTFDSCCHVLFVCYCFFVRNVCYSLILYKYEWVYVFFCALHITTATAAAAANNNITKQINFLMRYGVLSKHCAGFFVIIRCRWLSLIKHSNVKRAWHCFWHGCISKCYLMFAYLYTIRRVTGECCLFVIRSFLLSQMYSCKTYVPTQMEKKHNTLTHILPGIKSCEIHRLWKCNKHPIS